MLDNPNHAGDYRSTWVGIKPLCLSWRVNFWVTGRLNRGRCEKKQLSHSTPLIQPSSGPSSLAVRSTPRDRWYKMWIYPLCHFWNQTGPVQGRDSNMEQSEYPFNLEGLRSDFYWKVLLLSHNLLIPKVLRNTSWDFTLPTALVDQYKFDSWRFVRIWTHSTKRINGVLIMLMDRSTNLFL